MALKYCSEAAQWELLAECVMSEWYLYIVRAADGSLYTGVATDVERRLAEHVEGGRGAKYLRGRAPLELVYEAHIGSRGLALKVEKQLKRLSKTKKESIVASDPDRSELLEMMSIPEG